MLPIKMSCKTILERKTYRKLSVSVDIMNCMFLWIFLFFPNQVFIHNRHTGTPNFTKDICLSFTEMRNLFLLFNYSSQQLNENLTNLFNGKYPFHILPAREQVKINLHLPLFFCRNATLIFIIFIKIIFELMMLFNFFF